jgi:hypothetical protein
MMCGYCAQSCSEPVMTIRPGNTPYCSYACALHDYQDQLRRGQRLWWDYSRITEYHAPSTAITVLTNVLAEKETRIRQLTAESRVLRHWIESMLPTVLPNNGKPK